MGQRRKQGKNILRQMKKKTIVQNNGFNKRGSNREVYSDTGPPQETRKISNEYFIPKGTRKRTKPKVRKGRK